LMIGFYGVLFELYSPGWGVPGTLGVVCLAVSFFSLAVLPVRFAGLLLITVGLAMFVAEVFATAYGALALGGVVCIVLGGLMLVESPAGFVGVSLNVLLPFAVATGLITFVLVAGVMRAHRRRAATGAEGQLGAAAVAETDFQPAPAGHAGTVWMHGEHWQATSAEPVPRAAQLEVVGREGLTLRVRPAVGPEPASPATRTSPSLSSPASEPHS
jgi:membrane-bound serine protease (ClpP class)